MDFTLDFEENEEDMEEHIVLSFSGPDVEAKEPSSGAAARIERTRPRSASEPASQEADTTFLKPPMEHYRAKRPRPAPIPVDGEGVLGLPEAHRSALSSLSGIKTDTDVSLPPAPLYPQPSGVTQNAQALPVLRIRQAATSFEDRRSLQQGSHWTIPPPTYLRLQSSPASGSSSYLPTPIQSLLAHSHAGSGLTMGAFIGVLAEYALATEMTTTVLYPRQDPDNPSTSSMNWWPYPAYSEWGSPSASPAAAVPTPTEALTSMYAAVGSSSNLDSSTLLPAITSAPPNTALSTASPQSGTSLSSASTTTITAIPPAKSPGRRFKRPRDNSFDIVYLSPVFALLGAIVGAIVTCLLVHLIRQRNLRASALKAGPAYASTSARDDTSSTSEQNSEQHFLGREGAITRPTRGSLLSRAASTKSSWLVRAFSSHRREPAAASSPEDPEAANRVSEDDPFLAPSTTSGPFRARSSASMAQTRFELLRTPDVLSEDEELDNAPYETLRHKSIRRGILERLQGGPQHRRGHARGDSDVTVEGLRAKQPDFLPVPSFGNDSPSPSRSRSSTNARTETAGVLTPQSSGPGFRIVQDDPEDDARSSLLGGGWLSPWSSPRKGVVQDNLTALPARRSPSPSKSRLVDHEKSPTKTRYPVEKFPFPRIDSTLLPSSPPRVTSPPLEAQLFFGSLSPRFESAPALSMATASSSHTSSESSASASSSHPHKLHTHRQPAALPFPSSPQYTNRLTKAPRRSFPTTLPGRVSPGPTVAQSPADKILRGHALDMVEQILEQSWSARDLRGVERVRSPTMFGAVP